MPRIIGDLDRLETTIQHAGRSEEHTKLKEAEEQANRIREEAQQKADTIRTELVRESQAQARQQRRQQRAEAARKARRAYLTTREELLDQVWKEAEQRLRRLPEDTQAYAEVLRHLTWQAIQTLGTGHLLLAADPQGHELLTRQRLQAWNKKASDEFGESVTLERVDKPIDAWGGLIVTDSTQRRQVNLTFATRLTTARDELRDIIFQQMVQKT